MRAHPVTAGLLIVSIGCVIAAADEPNSEAAKQVKDLEARIEQASVKDDYPAAIKAAEELLALHRRVRGAEHHLTSDAHRQVDTLHKVSALTAEQRQAWNKAAADLRAAQELTGKGRWAQALERVQALPDFYRQVVGEDHPQTAAARVQVGIILNALSRFPEADKQLRAALAALEKSLGPQHGTTGTCCTELAHTLRGLGKTLEAGEFYRRALDTHMKLYGAEHCSVDFHNLALNLDEQGKHAEAEALHRRSLALRLAQEGDEHLETANGMNSLGYCLNAQGKYAAAEPFFRRALEIRLRLRGEEDSNTAMSYNNIAYNLYQQGHLPESEVLFRRALSTWQKIWGDGHQLTNNGRSNLAASLGDQGKYAEAEPLLRQALVEREKHFGPDHPDVATTCDNLGYNLTEQRKLKEGQALLERAVAIRERVQGSNQLYTAISYNGLAHNYSSQGRHQEACAYQQRALDIFTKVLGTGHPNTTPLFRNLALELHTLGRHEEELKAFQSAARSFEAARLRASARGLGRSAFAAENSTWDMLAAALVRARRPGEAWAALENNLARGLLDEAGSRGRNPFTPDELAEEARLSRAIDALQAKIVPLSAKKSLTAEEQQTLDGLLEQRNQAERQTEELAAKVSQRELLSLDKVQACLGSATALICWIDTHDEATVRAHLACVVRGDRPPAWVQLPGTREDRTWSADDHGLAQRVRRALAQRDPELPNLLQKLATQRLTPLREHLGGVRQLLFVPTGPMAGVPIEALLDAEDTRTCSYVPSATALGKLKARPRAEGPRKLLALGDPVFPPREKTTAKASSAIPTLRAGSPVPLPGTRREVNGITPLFDDALTLLGSEASEQTLQDLQKQKRLASFRFLHFATHGQAKHDQAFQSALLLAQDQLPDPVQQQLAGKKPVDGQLTAQEVLDEWDLNADLVVLSACETGLGQKGGGDGFLGFSQAFLLAGSRSVILSQWQVSDSATSLLMVRFYENLLGKRPGDLGALTQPRSPMSKAEALKEAKHWLRNLRRKEAEDRLAKLPEAARGLKLESAAGATPQASERPFEHPFYWSAFILIGDPE